MNIALIFYIIGRVLQIEAVFLLPSCAVALSYGEWQGWVYLGVAAAAALAGQLICMRKPKNMTFLTRDGFAAVSLSWLVLSAVGALPLRLCGDIRSYTDALFETISGFTTTGASILTDVEALSYSSLFWRSLTHWIGGMGVLVFLLAIVPMHGGTHMQLMRAESPGPSVGKLVPRVRSTAKILYLIYLGLTATEVILLLCGGMPLFDSLTLSFGTAGTGGFAPKNTSVAGYSPYLQWVITIFMIMFGVNFNIYFLLLMRRFRDVAKNDEFRSYLLIILTSVALIVWNLIRSGTAIGMAFGGGDYQFSNLAITVAFDDDGESAQIVSSPIANVPAAKTSKLLMVLNQCNCDFRWVKFYMDEDYDIIADADVVFGDDNAGFAVVEAVLLAASVIDDAYPEIMRGIWG